MPKTYTVTVYDQDGFPLAKGESVLVRQEKDFNDQPILVVSNNDGMKSARFGLIGNQPKFNESTNLPFMSYKLLNNFTISIKTET